MAPLKALARAALVGASRLSARADVRTRRRVVLCYHSVHPELRYASVSPALFGEHLGWLSDECELVEVADIYREIRGDDARPRVAITFDDGYVDNWTHAAPLLARHGARATFFLTAGFLERDAAVMERFAFLRGGATCDPLSWAQARALRAAGHAIGAHTWSHPVLAALDHDDQARELQRGKDVIEQRLGEAVTMLAYPFGKPRRHFDDATARLAATIGYRLGAAVAYRGCDAGDDRLAVPRFFVTYDALATLQAKVRGDYDALGWWHERAPRWAARLVSPQDFAWTRPCA